MNLGKSLREGAALATRQPAPLIILFGAYLVASLVLTLPVVAAFNAWLGQRLILRDVAGDFSLMLPIESLLSGNVLRQGSASSGATGDTVALALVTMLMTALVANMAGSLIHAVLGGGILLTYVQGRWSVRQFVWGAWRWCMPFVVLWAIFSACATLITTLGSIVWGVLSATGASVLSGAALVLTGLVYLALSVTFEYARVIAVTRMRRNIFWALGRATAWIIRRPAQTVGLYVLMVALGLALMPLYAGIVAPLIPFAWGVVGIAAQQLVVAGRMWTRLARWAGEMTLYRQWSQVDLRG